jgi:hypothetical protein
MQPDMVRKTSEIMRKVIQDNVETSIIINNRAGGNAPMIAQRVAEEFLRK